MNRRLILLGILALFVAGQARATVMDTWTEISLQFTNLGRGGATNSAVGVSTITATSGGTHLQSVTFASVPGLRSTRPCP